MPRRAQPAPRDWLSLIIDHHERIEDAVAKVKAASGASERRSAQKWLGVILTGHSIAEESVIYPALMTGGEKGHAQMGYSEQEAVKVQMAELEKMDPESQDYLDKLEHIRGALAHHVYEEEGTWYPELKDSVSGEDQSLLTQRYREEFDRYVGKDTGPATEADSPPFIPPVRGSDPVRHV